MDMGTELDFGSSSWLLGVAVGFVCALAYGLWIQLRWPQYRIHFDQVSACTTAPSTRAPLTSSRPVFHSSRFYILFFFPLALLPRSRFPTRIIIFWFVGSKHAFLQQKHAFLEQKQKNKPFHHMQHFRIYLCSCSECLSSDTKTHFEWWVPSKKEKKMRNT